MMKNKFVIIITCLILAVPAFSEEMTVPQTDNSTIYEEVIPNEEANTDEVSNTTSSVEEVPAVLPYKQPVNKKKIVKKFLFAMLGVGLSSVIIYIGLTIYNKIREGFSSKTAISSNKTSLTMPDTTNEAIKSFLDNTKWDN